MNLIRRLLHFLKTVPWSDDTWSVDRWHRHRDAMTRAGQRHPRP